MPVRRMCNVFKLLKKEPSLEVVRVELQLRVAQLLMRKASETLFLISLVFNCAPFGCWLSRKLLHANKLFSVAKVSIKKNNSYDKKINKYNSNTHIKGDILNLIYWQKKMSKRTSLVPGCVKSGQTQLWQPSSPHSDNKSPLLLKHTHTHTHTFECTI